MTLCYQMDEKYEMIRKAVREFAESEIKPVAGELDEKEEFSVSLTRQMGDIGLFGMMVPEGVWGPGSGLYFLYHRHRGDCPGGWFTGRHPRCRQFSGHQPH